MGRLICHFPWKQFHRNFSDDPATGSCRYLFYNPDRLSAYPVFSSDDWHTQGKKGIRKQSFFSSDPDHLHCHQSWHGQSGRCGCRSLSRRRWRCILDVADGSSWSINCLCRSISGSEIQRPRSSLRRLPWRSCLLHP